MPKPEVRTSEIDSRTPITGIRVKGFGNSSSGFRFSRLGKLKDGCSSQTGRHSKRTWLVLPTSYTLHPSPIWTRNPEPRQSARYPKPETRISEPESRKPRAEALNSNFEIRNPTTQTRNRVILTDRKALEGDMAGEPEALKPYKCWVQGTQHAKPKT